MDPLLENVFVNLIANGLSAILSQIAQKGRDFISKRRELEEFVAKDESLAVILRKASAIVDRSIPHQNNDFVDNLREVLSSPEVDAIVRQIFSNQLAKEQNGHIDGIRRLFLQTLSLRLGKSVDELRDLATEVFDAIYNACDRALSLAIDNGILAGHEAKSAVRHRMILNELAAVKKSLTILTDSDLSNFEAYLDFETKYRHQIKNRHAYITPPNFDSARKLPIDEIYVSPDFVPASKRKSRDPERLQVRDFLNVLYRAVLLGNPGGGKSTFATKTSHDLAERYEARLIAGRQLSPVLIILRDYGAEKKTRNCSILQFIEATANSHYQITPPKGAFEYLLLNGR